MGKFGRSRVLQVWLDFLLKLLNPDEVHKTLCGLLCPSGYVYEGTRDTVAGYFLPRLPESGGLCLYPMLLPGSSDVVMETGPSTEGPQRPEEKGCTAVRCGARASSRGRETFP